MEYCVKTSPHIKTSLSTKRIMNEVSICLLFIYLFSIIRYWFIGQEYVLHIFLLLLCSLTTSVFVEAAYAFFCKKKDILHYLSHSFPWVTPLILTLMVPVNTSIYALGISTFIAVFFGKMVFGGFGQNVFNPAAVGRAIVFSSFAGSVQQNLLLSATPTRTAASAGWIFNQQSFTTFLQDFGGLENLFMGNYDGALGETCSLLILMLGVYLAFRKIIDWYIPCTYLTTIFVGTFFVGLPYGISLPYACFHLLTGGVMFGAFFMLTDPVTIPNTRAGKLVFSCLVAILTVLIRFLANLPEGVLYAILLGNLLTPAIDKYFDGKSILRKKKDTYTVLAVFTSAILIIYSFSFALCAKEYHSLRTPTFTPGENIALNELEITPYHPVLEEKQGNIFRVSVNGFGTMSKEDGGQGGVTPYQRNVFEITMSDDLKNIHKVAVIQMGDTIGVGDKIKNEGFLKQFEGKDLQDKFDVVAGASFSSRSLLAAAKYVLSGEYQHISLETDFSEYDAKIVAQKENLYVVEVKGFGTLGAGHGADYSLNQFEINVENKTIQSIRCTHFGDTKGVGEKAVSTEALQHLSGLTLSDQVDTVSGASYTSRSVFAALQVVLRAISGD